MNIRQAAQWAEKKGCVYRVGYDGQPDYMYAVYSVRTHEVLCVGYHAKCSEFVKSYEGSRWDIKMVSLDQIIQEMGEEAGELGMIPDACEVREWA